MQSDPPGVDSALPPRAQRLLIYLLLHRKAPIPRKNLAFSLWPDMPEDESLGTLRRALSDLRAGLPRDQDWVLTSRDTLAWNRSASCWLDVEAFEEQIHRAEPESLLRATELYRGDLLRDMDEEWLIPERERCRQMQFEALRKLSRHYRSLQNYSVALEYSRRALTLDPLSELAYQDRIRLHSLAGDRTAALLEYERLKSVLQRELGVEPAQDTRLLVEKLVRGEPVLAAGPGPASSAALPAFPQPPLLVGRESETRKLLALWEAASDGHGGLAIVSGEAGVGKSHLLRNLAYQVSRGGGLSLIGYCYEFENSLPYQPVIELLRPVASMVQSLPLPAIERAALAKLLPEAFDREEFPDAMLSPEEVRSQFFEALLRTFLLLSESHCVLLIIEDTHWASESTLDWLTYVTPRLAAHRILVIVTYRTDEIHTQHAVVRLARRFERDQVVSSIPLQRLSREDNREWVAHLSGLDKELAQPAADRIFLETAGNPFFLEEIVRGMIETGRIRWEEGKWAGAFVQEADQADIPFPDSLRDTILSRTSRLTEIARLFLQIAAVAGRTFQYELVHRAGAWSDESALSALDELCARGFIQEGESPGVFFFTHHLMQEVIYADLGTPRRKYCHRLLAQTTQALHPEDFASIAYHYLAASERDLGIEYSRKAAERAAALYAYEEACRHLQTAQQLLKRGEHPELRLALLEALADNQRYLRQGIDAVWNYQIALELWGLLGEMDKMTGVRLYRKLLQTTAGMWETTDFEQAAFAARVRAGLHRQMGSLLDSIEGLMPDEQTVHLLRALALDLLIFDFPAGRDRSLEHARAAVTLAEQLDDPVATASALSTVADVYGANGLLRERVDIAFQAVQLSRDRRFQDSPARVRMLIGMGKALIGVGEYQRAIPYLEEAEHLAEQIRAVHEINLALSFLHQCLFRLDRWDEMSGTEERRRALQNAYPLQRIGAPCYAIALTASVHALRGDTGQANALQRESYSIMTAISGAPDFWKRSHRY